MTNNLDKFRKDYLGANSWPHRRDGVRLDLLDNLTTEELKIAEAELINALSLQDDWPIVGLGHIKSNSSIPALYNLLKESKGAMKVIIAYSIFHIVQDPEMIDIVLETTPTITNQFELIDILYYLSDFKDKRVIDLLNNYRNHKDYLVAYNATRYLGLSTDKVLKKFRT